MRATSNERKQATVERKRAWRRVLALQAGGQDTTLALLSFNKAAGWELLLTFDRLQRG